MNTRVFISALGLTAMLSASAFSPRHAASTLPREARGLADSEWKTIGTGSMTDFVVGDLFWMSPQTVTVTVEQNTADPNSYRIARPYANWNEPSISRYVKYDASKATPMVIHVAPEGGYAWFEEFDTGLDLDLSFSGFPDKGELTVKMWGADLVNEYGAATVALEGPTTLCTYSDGVLTLKATGSFRTQAQHNVLCDIGGKYAASGNYYVANYDDEFRIVLFGDGQVEEPDEPDDSDFWETIGMAKYTDDLMTLLYEKNAPNPTWEVEMQRYKNDATMYRLVNPYAGWDNPFSDVYYDSGKNYYMVVYTMPALGLACIGDFETGVSLNGMGKMGITTDAYYLSSMYGLDFTAQIMPEIFPRFDGKSVTYPATLSLEGENYPSMMAWFGTYSETGLYAVNSHGKFRIEFPSEENAVEGVGADSLDCEPEYFNLQGVRLANPEKGSVVIKKQGGKTEKMIF